MTKEEVVQKLKSEYTSIDDKVAIFNWFLENESDHRICTFEGYSTEFNLKDQHIQGLNSAMGIKLLDYSMIKIKEHLDILPKSSLDLTTYLFNNVKL